MEGLIGYGMVEVLLGKKGIFGGIGFVYEGI